MAEPSPESPPIGDQRAERAVLSILSLGAAAIHFAVIGDHFDEFWIFGLFFLVVAWFQAAWAVLVVVVTDRRLLAIGAIVNTAVVIVWVFSRTTGLPIGPEPGTAEAASFLDVLSTILEVILVAGCAEMLRAARPLGDLPQRRREALLAAAALVTLGTTSWALVTTAGERGHHREAEHGVAAGGRQETGGTHEHDESGELGSEEIRTVALGHGIELQTFVTAIAPGKNQLHLTFYDAQGDETPIASLGLKATSDGDRETLEATQLSPGHFISSTVPAGGWTFTLNARDEGGEELNTEFTFQIDS